jgi:tetratricopeptide (TPR) repeat protein
MVLHMPNLVTANPISRPAIVDEQSQIVAIDSKNIDEMAVNAANLIQTGDVEQALPIMLKLLEIQPFEPNWHYNIGNLHYRSERYEQAFSAYMESLQLEPMHYSAWFNLAKTSQALKNQEGVWTAIEVALKIKPCSEEALKLKANCCDVLQKNPELIQCLDALQKIRNLSPNEFLQLGNAYQSIGQFESAIQTYKKISGENLCFEVIQNNLGNAYLAMHQYEVAENHYKRALEYSPEYQDAQCNLAQLWARSHSFEQAETAFKKILEIDPEHTQAQWNLALLHLIQGNFQVGFRFYESRWLNSELGIVKRFTDEKLWRGDIDIRGRHIYIWEEQGLGDKIQMMRYANLLADREAIVTLEMPENLFEISQTLSEKVHIVRSNEIPERLDLHCPYMSLPLAFGTTLETIPRFDYYLKPPQKAVNKWKSLIISDNKMRVGLVWSGAKRHANDHNRTMSLEHFEPCFGLKNIVYYSLQKEYRDKDRALIKEYKNILHDHSIELENFSDTAALIAQLDLVISVDTSVAHLAGAIGKPVWLLLPHNPDFRWLLDRCDTPWYPTMKLFRQSTPNNWKMLISCVKNNLEIKLNEIK